MTEAQQIAPVVRMDKSRDFATCHGERTIGNPHQAVHFYQNGLPFDARGELILDHADFEPDSDKPSSTALKLREKADKLVQKAIKNAAPKAEGEPAAEAGEDDEPKGPVNLEQWARGEARVPWPEVTQAIARRFSRRVANKADAIELLVKERVVNTGELSDEHRKLLDE